MRNVWMWIPVLGWGALYLGSLGEPVMAQTPAPRLGDLRRPSVRGLRQLNLSDDQLRQLQRIRHRRQAELLDRRLELRAARRRLQELLAGDAPNSEVTAQFERVQQLTQEVNAKRFEAVLEMRQVLTPEQRRQLLQILEEAAPF